MSAPRESIDDALVRRGPGLAAVIVALAAVLRVPDLFGWWLNPDEGIYYGVVTRDGFGAAWAEAMTTAHPPLYFLILRAVGWISTDLAVLRSVSLVSAVAAVYVFILVGREIGGSGVRGQVTGLVAGLLLAASPRSIVLSLVIRPYMLLVLLLACSLLLLLRYLRAPSARLLLAHGACSVLAVLLHYSSAFGLVVMGTLILVNGVRQGLGRPEWRRLVVAQAIPSAVLVALYFVHLRGIAAGPLGDHALEGWLAPYMISRPVDVWLGFVGLHSMFTGDAWAAPTALFTLGAMVYAGLLRSRSPVFVMSAVSLALAVAGATLQAYPFGPTRHSAWLLVFVIPTLAWAFGDLLTSGRARLAKLGPIVLIGLLGARLLGPILDPEDRPRDTTERVLRTEALEAMVHILDSEAGPRVVLMSTETYQMLMPLYNVARQSAERSNDGEMLRFRWEARDVIVLPGLDFSSRPEEVGQPNHLYTGARVAEGEFGIPLHSEGEPVLVLSGGWRFQGMSDLADLARRVGPLGTTTSVPGLIALYLDLDAYGRALGDPRL